MVLIQVCLSIFCCLTTVLSCQEEIILCPRPNMTCATSLCSCAFQPTGEPRFLPFMICSNVNFTDIPSDIPTEVWYMSFYGNNITTLKNGSFKEVPNLKELHLSNNDIRVIEPLAFADPPNLAHITLSNNKIQNIEPGTFSDLKSVFLIDLTGNNITILREGTFKNLPHLFRIYLDRNSISVIEGYAFCNLQTPPGTIFVLSLTNNAILTIEDNAFVNVPLTGLYVGYNNLKRINMKMLTGTSPLNYIDLSNCQIERVETFAFADLPGLLTINLGLNPITVIEKQAFYNLTDLQRINNMATQEIESEAFVLLPKVNYIGLVVRSLTSIRPKSFWDLPGVQTIVLSGGNITRIESEAFGKLPKCTDIDLSSNKIQIIEQNAFIDLNAKISLDGNMIIEIELDAFVNVHSTSLIIGIEENFVMRENRNSTFRDIKFMGSMVSCNCAFMWFYFWLKDQNNTSVSGGCNGIGRTIAELTIDDFNNCEESIFYTCNISLAVEIMCPSRKYISSDFSHWVHSRNGNVIRQIQTAALFIPFCSQEDVGEYTCVRRTKYLAMPELNSSSFLYVNGPPTVLDQSTNETTDYLELTVMFMIYPFSNEPKWFLQGNEILPNDQYHINTSTVPVTITQYETNVLVEGFRTSLIILNHKTLPDAAYTCKISNEFGEVEEVVLSRSANIVIPRNMDCNVTFKVEIRCVLDFYGGIPDLWIHSTGGQFIRSLEGTVYNNTNVLEIPFCSHQDIGDYTCGWKTDIPNLSHISKTTTLSVHGPPLILSYSVSSDGKDTVLSVLFFSSPFPKAPEWDFDNTPVGTRINFLQTTTYTTIQMRQHKVIVERPGFISNLTIIDSKYSGNFLVIVENTFGTARQHIVVSEENKGENAADSSTSNNTPVIIGALSASVIAVVILISVSVVVWRRKMEEKNTYNEPRHERQEEDYDTIEYYDRLQMSQLQSNQPHDYMEVIA